MTSTALPHADDHALGFPPDRRHRGRRQTQNTVEYGRNAHGPSQGSIGVATSNLEERSVRVAHLLTHNNPRRTSWLVHFQQDNPAPDRAHRQPPAATTSNDMRSLATPFRAETAAIGADVKQQAAGLRGLNEGQRVTYEVVTERGKQAASDLQNA